MMAGATLRRLAEEQANKKPIQNIATVAQQPTGVIAQPKVMPLVGGEQKLITDTANQAIQNAPYKQDLGSVMLPTPTNHYKQGMNQEKPFSYTDTMGEIGRGLGSAINKQVASPIATQAKEEFNKKGIVPAIGEQALAGVSAPYKFAVDTASKAMEATPNITVGGVGLFKPTSEIAKQQSDIAVPAKADITAVQPAQTTSAPIATPAPESNRAALGLGTGESYLPKPELGAVNAANISFPLEKMQAEIARTQPQQTQIAAGSSNVFKNVQDGKTSYSDNANTIATPMSSGKRAEMERVYAGNPAFAKANMYTGGNESVSTATPRADLSQPAATAPAGTVSTISSSNDVDTSRRSNNGTDYVDSRQTANIATPSRGTVTTIPSIGAVAQPSAPIAMPQNQAFQQQPIISNVLADGRDSQSFKNQLSDYNTVIDRGNSRFASVKEIKQGREARQARADLLNFDVAGNQKTQLEQQQQAQQDLSQRRAEEGKQWAALLGEQGANRTLAQRQAEQAQNAAQFGVTQSLAERRLDLDARPKAEVAKRNWTVAERTLPNGDIIKEPFDATTGMFKSDIETPEIAEKQRNADIASALSNLATKAQNDREAGISDDKNEALKQHRALLKQINSSKAAG